MVADIFSFFSISSMFVFTDILGRSCYSDLLRTQPRTHLSSVFPAQRFTWIRSTTSSAAVIPRQASRTLSAIRSALSLRFWTSRRQSPMAFFFSRKYIGDLLITSVRLSSAGTQRRQARETQMVRNLGRGESAQRVKFSKTQPEGTRGYVRLEVRKHILLHQHPRLMTTMPGHRT